MKKNYAFFKAGIILLGFFIVNGCNRDTQDAVANLRPYNNASLTYNISPAANSYGFLFYSSADWKAFITCKLGELDITEGPTVYPASGKGSIHLQSVNFTVPENISEHIRTFYLTIVSGDKSMVVIIYQRSDLGTLHVDPLDVALPSLGGSATINVESNVDWTSQVLYDWVMVSPGSGPAYQDANVILSATQNRTGYRTSTVLFQADTMTRTVNVTQHAFHVSLPATTTLSYDGPHTMDFSVLSSLSWEISSNASWCTVQTATHDAAVAIVNNQIYVEANPGGHRTAKLTATNLHNEKQTFTVSQSGDLSLLYNTNWTGTATLQASFVTQTGSMSMTIVDEDNIIMRGYPGQIIEFTDNTIQFQVYIDEITYGGFTGYNVSALFVGTFSPDQSRITGTITGTGTVMGLTLDVSGTFDVSR
jgi:hypothetical protein